ncbi:MAG: hypothetical protein WD206_01405 [Actinomycetota bacterium]
MTTKQVEPDLDSRRDQEIRQEQARRRRRIGAFALAAVIGVAAVALLLVIRPGQDTITPANEPSVINPVDPSAVAVATRFVEAFGAFDGKEAITYLADNPYLEMDATTPEEVPAFTSFLEAQGYEQIPVGGCSVTGSSASGTAVRCRFNWHAIRSDEIGLGPYPGFWDLTVRDGEIGSVSLYWEIKKFSPQMWEPFRNWVSSTYPKNFAVMYVDSGSNFRLTEESIGLWELRTKEYVEKVNQGNAG